MELREYGRILWRRCRAMNFARGVFADPDLLTLFRTFDRERQRRVRTIRLVVYLDLGLDFFLERLTIGDVFALGHERHVAHGFLDRFRRIEVLLRGDLFALQPQIDVGFELEAGAVEA